MGNPEMYDDSDVPMPRDYKGATGAWEMVRTSDAQQKRAYWDTVPMFSESFTHDDD